MGALHANSDPSLFNCETQALNSNFTVVNEAFAMVISGRLA